MSKAVLVWAPLFVLALGSSCGVSEIPRPGGSGPDSGVGAPANDGVIIAGVPVPRDRVLVFLHIGHSNMAGRANSPAALRGYNYDPHPRLWSYAKGSGFRPAVEPLSPDSMTAGRAGPGMSILRAALALAPQHHMVSIGHGHSGQTGGYCRNFRRGGLFYDLTMAAAAELKGKVTFAGVFTMFGTSEVNDRSNLPRFGDCMTGLAADIRADLGEPALPFLIGDWEAESMTSLTPDSPTGMVIIPQLRALPTRMPAAAVIPTEDLAIIPDDHHYDFTGHKQWAERGLAIMKDKGWAPWASR
jgi:hypothetical protein